MDLLLWWWSDSVVHGPFLGSSRLEPLCRLAVFGGRQIQWNMAPFSSSSSSSSNRNMRFRCYKRMSREKGGLQAARKNLNPRFHPCKAFISNKCGSGLLGVPVPCTSECRERMADYRLHAKLKSEVPSLQGFHLQEVWKWVVGGFRET